MLVGPKIKEGAWMGGPLDDKASLSTKEGTAVYSTGIVTASKGIEAGLVENSPRLDGQSNDSTAQSRGSNMRS